MKNKRRKRGNNRKKGGRIYRRTLEKKIKRRYPREEGEIKEMEEQIKEKEEEEEEGKNTQLQW